ncbi:MAG: ferritin-like domain-containing protein [Deltaproteobacteria bacterium]|nr:ferritin-like domain-containing protein [Deltaproteobacteria bacterium]
MRASTLAKNVVDNLGVLRDATQVVNLKVLKSMLGPAWRGLVEQRAKRSEITEIPTAYTARFDWAYHRDQPELASLYSKAKASQWNAETDLDWSIEVDPHHPERTLIMDEILPLEQVPAYRGLPRRQQQVQKHGLLSWMLSQFLHGEQGALFAACQLTEAVSSMDGKFYGSTQVVDEGRHVEVFHRYLTEKLGKLYQINDNLYVLIDALMSDGRWDIKFLSMQIMIEGLALGAFGTMRHHTEEPLLKELLRYVITDEARHVHFGVVALRDYYLNGLTEKERQEREDWAFETSVLMRNRFLAHEFYDEFYGHVMRRSAWNRLILESEFMSRFRTSMFRRIVPNLKRIGLLSERIRPHYQKLGLLAFEHDKAAPDLTTHEVLAA